MAFAKKYSSILGFIFLILPKCPFCIAAYSGAVAICGASTLIAQHPDNTDWRAYIALGISIAITACVLFTNRTRKYYTIMAGITLCGLLLVCIGLTPKSTEWFKIDAMTCYYTGSALLVAAIFIYSEILPKLFEILKITNAGISRYHVRK